MEKGRGRGTVAEQYPSITRRLIHSVNGGAFPTTLADRGVRLPKGLGRGIGSSPNPVPAVEETSGSGGRIPEGRRSR